MNPQLIVQLKELLASVEKHRNYIGWHFHLILRPEGIQIFATVGDFGHFDLYWINDRERSLREGGAKDPYRLVTWEQLQERPLEQWVYNTFFQMTA